MALRGFRENGSCVMLENGGFMNTNDIVLAIYAEIAQLQKMRALLTDPDLAVKRRPDRPDW